MVKLVTCLHVKVSRKRDERTEGKGDGNHYLSKTSRPRSYGIARRDVRVEWLGSKRAGQKGLRCTDHLPETTVVSATPDPHLDNDSATGRLDGAGVHDV